MFQAATDQILAGTLDLATPDRAAFRKTSSVVRPASSHCFASGVRSAEGEECELDVYSKLQSEHAMPHAALTRMVRGVSCRDYAAVVETARAGFGVKKSSVSKHFMKASSEQLAEFDERRFDNLTFAAIFIDGVNFGGEMLVVALGVDSDGTKHVLGLRHGETENAEVVILMKDIATTIAPVQDMVNKPTS